MVHNNFFDSVFTNKVVYIGWILFQIFIFLYNFSILSHDVELSNTVNKLNYSFLISRSSALLININFMLLLLLINRNIVSFLCHVCSINNYYHITIFSSIIFFSIIHIISHIFNYYYLTSNDNDIKTLLKTPTSITGIFLIFLMIVIYIFSLKSLRTNVYELFLIMHYLLCTGICVCLLVHSLSCFFRTNSGTCLESSFWRFIVIPTILLVGERMYREYIGNKYTVIVKVKKHSHDCTEIELYKPFFEFKPGQFILLNCPSISKFQWHPFTITSDSIEKNRIQLFIKERGEWTRSLSELLLTNNFYKNNINLKVSLPYGCSYNIISRYRTVLLIAGGIGITSFISILKSLPYNIEREKDTYIKKMQIHWMCKNIHDFQHFINDLYKIKCKLDEYDNNLLELYFYVTQDNTISNTLHTTFPKTIEFINGRPDFNQVFEKLNKNSNYTNNYIKLIVCGSQKLHNNIYKIKQKYGNKFCL